MHILGFNIFSLLFRSFGFGNLDFSLCLPIPGAHQEAILKAFFNMNINFISEKNIITLSWLFLILEYIFLGILEY